MDNFEKIKDILVNSKIDSPLDVQLLFSAIPKKDLDLLFANNFFDSGCHEIHLEETEKFPNGKYVTNLLLLTSPHNKFNDYHNWNQNGVGTGVSIRFVLDEVNKTIACYYGFSGFRVLRTMYYETVKDMLSQLKIEINEDKKHLVNLLKDSRQDLNSLCIALNKFTEYNIVRRAGYEDEVVEQWKLFQNRLDMISNMIKQEDGVALSLVFIRTIEAYIYYFHNLRKSKTLKRNANRYPSIDQYFKFLLEGIRVQFFDTNKDISEVIHFNTDVTLDLQYQLYDILESNVTIGLNKLKSYIESIIQSNKTKEIPCKKLFLTLIDNVKNNAIL